MPHLWGHPLTGKQQRDHPGKKWPAGRGTVHLHQTQSRYSQAVVDLVDQQTRIVEHADIPAATPVSGLIMFVSTAQLTPTLERAAARLGTWPVIMPQAAEWLRDVIRKQTERGSDITIYLHRPDDIIPTTPREQP